MREIKFRSYNAKNKEWLYGCYLINRGEHFICPDGIQPADKTSEDFQIVPETLGQFTCLHDFYGKEIYEGDIINSEDDFIHVINYARSCACFLVTTPGDRYSTFSRILTQDWINEYQKKVIGNIYDNPELLKGGGE